jgi:hypothetical protein
MAITLTISPSGNNPLTQIQDTNRILRTVTATIAASTDDILETIDSVTATLQQNEPEVVIGGGITSVSINGTYIDPFIDSFTYVERDSNNLIGSPITIIGTANVPPNKYLYNLLQDTRENSIRTYNVTVNTNLTTQQFVVTHSINNEFEGIRSFMANYYD